MDHPLRLSLRPGPHAVPPSRHSTTATHGRSPTQEIEAVLPAPASADDLYDTFGGSRSTWNEFVNTRSAGSRPRASPACATSRGTAAALHHQKSGAVTARWETDRADAHSLAEAALNGTSVTIRDSDGDGNSWVNEAATAEASDMIAQIREEWDRWAFEDPERADRLCAEYTRRYRSHVPRDYAEAPIDPQGLRSDRLRSHQRQRSHPPVRRQPVGPPGGRWEDR